MLQTDACLIIGVKIQRECEGQGVDSLSRKLSVTNKLLINLDLEGHVRVSSLSCLGLFIIQMAIIF